jgi:putative FmdB family regulatory protein
MPIYEYRCTLCGKEFEVIRFSREDETEVECPACGKKKAEKVISLTAGSYGSCSTSGSSCSFT